jgi:hypothetical protein
MLMEIIGFELLRTQDRHSWQFLGVEKVYKLLPLPKISPFCALKAI